jgi:hypothetical protein
MTEPYPTYIENPLVRENPFLKMAPEQAPLPTFQQSKQLLPEPQWDGHGDALACYWKTWELAFRWFKQPTPANGFVANYIDTAFNNHLFLWDSVFILMFGRYGRRAFDFQRTLDNLYCKQHPDGSICREINEADGGDYFSRFDPSATGPNVFAWSEWEHWRHFADKKRLAAVFPVVLAYHQWLSKWHSWPDGGMWSTGWGCGMDNQPRVEGDPRWDHGHQAWSDACLQQLFSARLLERMAVVLRRKEERVWLKAEIKRLEKFCRKKLWDPESAYFYDRKPDGTWNRVKSIAAYWALLAEATPSDGLEGFLAHLENPAEFNRPHRVPSLSADHPQYQGDGGYWLGGVWPSTNYMVLRGLTAVGRDKMAHEIGRNHLDQVIDVFKKTNTVWENYAPEGGSQGKPAKGDFVGWGGVGPIAVFFEYVLGLRPETEKGRLVWDVRLTETHGVKRYPFGKNGLVDLACEARQPGAKPVVHASSSQPLELLVKWEGGEEVRKVGDAHLARP